MNAPEQIEKIVHIKALKIYFLHLDKTKVFKDRSFVVS